MAEHVDATEPQLTDSDSAATAATAAATDVADGAAADDTEATTPSTTKLIGVFMVVASLVLVGLVGWLGYGAYQSHQAEQHRLQYLQVGRQAAINLTTLDYTEADEDVGRILQSATGKFLDEFNSRAKPLVDVIKQVKSKSVGTVTDAGVESVDGDHAQILVAVQVKTTTAQAAVAEPRGWRMRIDVQRLGSDVKVANVEFVS